MAHKTFIEVSSTMKSLIVEYQGLYRELHGKKIPMPQAASVLLDAAENEARELIGNMKILITNKNKKDEQV